MKRAKATDFFDDGRNGWFRWAIWHGVNHLGAAFVLGWQIGELAVLLSMVNVPTPDLLQELLPDGRPVFVSGPITESCQLDLVLRFQFRLLQLHVVPLVIGPYFSNIENDEYFGLSHVVQFSRSDHLGTVLVVVGNLSKTMQRTKQTRSFNICQYLMSKDRPRARKFVRWLTILRYLIFMEIAAFHITTTAHTFLRYKVLCWGHLAAVMRQHDAEKIVGEKGIVGSKVNSGSPENCGYNLLWHWHTMRLLVTCHNLVV